MKNICSNSHKNPSKRASLESESIFTSKVTWNSEYGDILEIFRDGKPFWDDFPNTQTHFCFGVRKARAILHCMDGIKEFYDSSGFPVHVEEKPLTQSFDPHFLTWYDEFPIHGRLVEKPYIKIEVDGFTRVGFGLIKAYALIQLEQDVRGFVEEFSLPNVGAVNESS